MGNRDAGSNATAIGSYNAWQTALSQTRGGYCVGQFKHGGIETAAIVLPRNTKSNPGDFGCVEQAVQTPQVEAGKKLSARLFLVDTRIDHVYRGIRFIEVAVNGKPVFRRDVADPVAKDWIIVDLTAFAAAESLKFQVRVVEVHGVVVDHSSWVFVGPRELYVE